MKGVILCAGKATRLQPFSYSQPKTLLPVANKPVLEYCIDKLTKQGIKEIGIVINPLQPVIKQYIGQGERFDANIQYFYQYEQKGISDALKAVEQFIDKDPFIVLLGDNLFAEELGTLVDSYRRNKSSGCILLSPVENPQDYGIAEISGNKIISLEEKPITPKSNLAIIGAYLFDPIIFQAIHRIQPSHRGEYEIINAIQWLIDQGHIVSHTETDKMFFDVGTVKRWLFANEWMMKELYNDRIVLGNTTELENCTLKGPVIVGDHCVLKNAVIGPYVSIQDESRVENCRIHHSILLEKAIVTDLKSTVSHSLFGREVVIKGLGRKNNKSLNFILGDKSFIGREE